MAHESAFQDVSAASRSGDTELKKIYTPGGLTRENPRGEPRQTNGVYDSTE